MLKEASVTDPLPSGGDGEAPTGRCQHDIFCPVGTENRLATVLLYGTATTPTR
jgi:hypothetical protein